MSEAERKEQQFPDPRLGEDRPHQTPPPVGTLIQHCWGDDDGDDPWPWAIVTAVYKQLDGSYNVTEAWNADGESDAPSRWHGLQNHEDYITRIPGEPGCPEPPEPYGENKLLKKRPGFRRWKTIEGWDIIMVAMAAGVVACLFRAEWAFHAEVYGPNNHPDILRAGPAGEICGHLDLSEADFLGMLDELWEELEDV